MIRVPDFITDWLNDFSDLEEVFIEGDITEEEVLYFLWLGGHIEPPSWVQERIDNELQPGEEEGEAS